MRLKEIEVDSEFEDLVHHVSTFMVAHDKNIATILEACRTKGATKEEIERLKEKGFDIPLLLITTALIAPELIKFKEKRSHWVLKSDYKMALLLNVHKEEYLSDKIFNYHEDADSILMADVFDDGGYKTRFTRNELSEILESHNSELTIEDFMVYEGEDDEN